MPLSPARMITVLKPIVHHTVTPARVTHTHGTSTVHGRLSGRPIIPSRWLMMPAWVSRRYFQITLMTATPSTYGAKKTPRKNEPARIFWFSSKDANGNAQVDHSGSAVILDPQARMVGI